MVSSFAVKLGRHQVTLVPGRWGIGRAPDCKIRFEDESVSWEHATLWVEDTRVVVEDCDSRNGVRVNGQRIHHAQQVRAGDRIQVGSEALTLLRLDAQDEEQVEDTRPLPALPDEERLNLLSPRERQVFGRLAVGKTQKVVAEELGLSVKTVETYKARIAEKLEVDSRADLVRFALDTGILGPNET